MPTKSATIADAIQLHQAGRFQEAERIYRQILDAEPTNVAAWHLIGRLADQLGEREAAVYCLRQAVSIRPDYAEAYCDLGTVLEAQGTLSEAAAAYQRAIELKPGYAVAHLNLGNCQRQQGHREAAIASFRAAVDADPKLVPAYASLGVLLTEDRKVEEAVGYFHDALRLMPQYPPALFGLGLALQQQEKFGDAVAYLRQGLDAQPDNIDARFQLGLIFEQQESLDDAIACYRHILELKPEHAKATHQLSRLLWISGYLDEALTRIRSFLAIEPNSAEAFGNLGYIYTARRQLDEASNCFERSIQLKPDKAEPHVGLALLRLLKGNFAEGWPEYEWRWKDPQMPSRPVEYPPWKGESLIGKTILLVTEQGFGDALQFTRYAEILQRLGASVSVGGPKSLVSLLKRCKGVSQVFGEGEDLPSFDFYTTVLSAPAVLQTEVHTIPANVPYLSADPSLMNKWRERLDESIPSQRANQAHRDLRVGINWHGRGGMGEFRQRDIPFDMFTTLSQLPGVRLISLRKTEGAGEPNAAAASAGIIDFGQEIDREHGAFMDTAAIMKNLDLVISSDTAVPHLAGALGVPVWLALPFAADWRWLLDRSDSPWYPSMRLFRQKKPGDWAGVFAEIGDALSAFVGVWQRLSSSIGATG
ncbi:MAG TPA: tetratricopeptide repeat protein [Pirellulaceae bacterium]|jgi:tetratricopeptide (TPR) repeat protein